MKHIFSYLLTLLWVGNLYAQFPDKIVFKSDTTACQIVVKNKKDGYHLFFRTGLSTTLNEIYPEHADFVYTENSMFVSTKLPDTNKKVWARCYFDGEYKLLQYKYVNYIASSERIFRLTPENEITETEKTSQRKRYIGEMIAILSKKIDFNFQKLQYNTKSLVRPLIQYHEINGLSFRDYNDYYPAKLSFGVFLGGGIESLILNLQPNEDFYGRTFPVENNEFFQSGGLTVNLRVPKLSERLYFTGSFELSRHNISTVRKIESSGSSIYYADLQYNSLSLSFPLGAGFDIIKAKCAVVALQTAVTPWIGLKPDAKLRLETEMDNVVQSKYLSVYDKENVDFFHHIGVKINSPEFSSGLSVIVGYNYSLTPDVNYINTISHKQAISFSATYNF